MIENNTHNQMDDEIDLLEIVAKLWKRKWTIILLTLLPTLLAVMFALLKIERVDLYKATTTIDAKQEEYSSLVMNIVSEKSFLNCINEKFPKITRENFSFSFSDKEKKKNKSTNIQISVVSPDQDLVAPVANFAPEVIEQILNSDYATLLKQIEEKRKLQEESIEIYQKNIKALNAKIKEIKNQKDTDYLLSLIATLNNSLTNISKSTILDISKVKVISKATRPALSIREEEIVKKERESQLSGKWKSKKIIVLVTFFTFLFLSIFLVLIVDFVKKNKENFKKYLDKE